jgi:NADH:ubiquinone oxidoreductase subunit C
LHIYNYIKIIKVSSCIQLNNCSDLVVYDQPNKLIRFTVIYCLLSTIFNYRINIFTQVNELSLLISLNYLYKSLLWSERECWDLFGLFFVNHPDLRRILTDYGFKGHPLQKDFPLTGFSELFYNDLQQQLCYTPVELTQESRIYINFAKKWI